MRLVPFLLWAALTALTTRLLGWWSVPLVAALMVVASALVEPRLAARVRGSAALGAGLAAALAWAALIAWDAMGPGFGAVRGILARLFALPWPAVLVVTLALPAALAWCAAAVTEGALALWRPAGDAPASRAALALDEPRSATLG
ncbi:hypothetical protein [Roseisolibacter agri]|uniref:Uncharacterized protein n=1 Tax=Roseisolibacter agri TaxID=2014610 RepID=A0AA37QGA2_9BACT|nr:hypothetical protein [Roseisolibacter agri]GLC26253.1 hypothetical protein rosag_27660 [Roseisolibacter agri]